MDWISVKDRLPEEDVQVLLNTTEGAIQGCRHISKSIKGKVYKEWDVLRLDEHGCGCCAGDYANVTHWMPLPEPPEQEK